MGGLSCPVFQVVLLIYNKVVAFYTLINNVVAVKEKRVVEQISQKKKKMANKLLAKSK